MTKSSLLANLVGEHLDAKTGLMHNHLNGSGNESELMVDVSIKTAWHICLACTMHVTLLM